MKVTTRHRYGLRAMVELARRGGHARLQDIADSQDISRKYLDTIFFTLKSANLVRGQRGTGGGQWLERDPAEITVGDVVRAIDGEIAVVDCVVDADNCPRSGYCVARNLWTKLSRVIEDCLDGTTLADLAEEQTDELKTVKSVG